MRAGVINALAAAALFGASVPLIKGLLGDMHPMLMAGLLYMGSGLGLALTVAGRSALSPR